MSVVDDEHKAISLLDLFIESSLSARFMYIEDHDLEWYIKFHLQIWIAIHYRLKSLR